MKKLIKKSYLSFLTICLLAGASMSCVNASAFNSVCEHECVSCGPDNAACSLICGICTAIHHHH